jgi:TolB-like protein
MKKQQTKVKLMIQIFLFCYLFLLNTFFSFAQQTNPSVAVVNLHVPRNIVDAGYRTNLDRSETMVGTITTALVQSRRFRVIERSRIDQIIREQGFQRSELSDTQVIRIGRLLGVQKIVTGEFPNITTGGYSGIVNIRLVDVESGTIEAAASRSIHSSSDFLTVANNLVEDLLK